jgi:hypothetical protein
MMILNLDIIIALLYFHQYMRDSVQDMQFQSTIFFTLLILLGEATLTVSYNQTFAEPGYQQISISILRSTSGEYQTISCPNFGTVDVDGGLFIERGNILQNGEIRPASWSSFHLASVHGRGQIISSSLDFQITGMPPNLDFIVQGRATEDTICNTRVPIDFTIHGSCESGSIARFESANGQTALLKSIGPNDDTLRPLCYVCPPQQVALDNIPLSCMSEDDARTLTVNESTVNYTDGGTNPSDVDANIGQVERDDIPSTDSRTITDEGGKTSQDIEEQSAVNETPYNNSDTDGK